MTVRPVLATAVLAAVAIVAAPTAAGAAAPAPAPAGVPKEGRYTFLLKLASTPAVQAYAGARPAGAAPARAAAQMQNVRIDAAQDKAVAALPANSPVLYRTHNLLAGVAVMTDVKNYGALRDLPGVAAVYPIAPKRPSNSTAIPLQGAMTAWASTPTGFTGQGVKIAIIDTGLDYTHKDFGGPGTEAAYATAKAADTTTPDPSSYDPLKFDAANSYDLAGDAYAPGDGVDTPTPDPNPLDCNDHGTHVAGSAAGYGVTGTPGHGGDTYSGPYDATHPDMTAMSIGPGMAPHAILRAYKVFGCTGSTNLVGQALDMAMDPAHPADVINMSLGTDYGSPQDGDSVTANAAVAAGATVVVASGNAGDHTDVGGSPGNARDVVTVANSQDSGNVDDALDVTVNGLPGQYGAERAALYTQWDTADLTGDVVRAPADAGGARTACNRTNGSRPYAAGALTGKVVLVEWTDDDLECGSVERSGNLAYAGATGFIFANSSETFAAGINGSAAIPGVLVTKTGGDAIRDALGDSEPVSVDGTTANAFPVVRPSDIDKINASSSRGIHATGNVKPDVAAVGTTVFSAGMGTGAEGLSETGTSMASPMVAGLAALVKQAHPSWSSAQIKADIVNTAAHDITTGGNGSGTRYAPNRVGAGRIDAGLAVSNDVLASSTDDPGTASISFGPVAVSGPTTLTKDVTVSNTGTASRTFTPSYDPITTVPGVTYVVSPSSVTVPSNGTATVTVTLNAPDPSALTKTVDPTIGRLTIGGSAPRETLAEASGILRMAPVGAGTPLRIPVYAAPRPVSTMSSAPTVSIAADQTGALKLTGGDLGMSGGTNGAGTDAQVQSLAMGFESTATSGLTPTCSDPSTQWPCRTTDEELDADIANVGVTADDTRAYFAVTTHGAWSVPSDKVELDVAIDTTGDGAADYYLYNTRVGGDDRFVAELQDAHTNAVIGDQALDARDGDTDAALYDSDAMILPVSLAQLGITSTHRTVRYGVLGFSNVQPDPVDVVGYDGAVDHVQLSADLWDPAIRVTGTSVAGPLLEDRAGAALTVHRSPGSLAADGGTKVLVLHLHNAVGDKAQLADLLEATTDTFTSNPGSPPGEGTTGDAPPSTGTTPRTTVTSVPSMLKVTRLRVSGARVTASIRLPGAGTLSVRATVRSQGTSLTYASASRTVNGGTGRVSLTPGGRARALLKKTSRRRRLTVTVRVTYRPTSGKAVTTSATAKVRGTRKR